MNEDKVMDYRGYGVYRVSNADQDDFEIWKNGKKVMSCETEAEAQEWIDDHENIKEQIMLAASKVQVIRNLKEGKSARDSLMTESDDALGQARIQLIESMIDFTDAWIAVLDAYEKVEDLDPDFADLFTEEYPFDKSFDEMLLKVTDWRDHLQDEFLK